MNQMLTSIPVRLGSRPLDGTRALVAATEAAHEARQTIAADPMNFDRALPLIELVVARFRAAFLAQTHAEAEGALAYHDQAIAELKDEFVPLYYRRAVLENVIARYERSTGGILKAYA